MKTKCDELSSDKKSLILTVGLPYSGKSTWAKKQGHPVVNPDAIRVAMHGQRFIGSAEPYVWAIAKTMVKALFLCGHDTVILDATNTTKARRDEWESSKWRVKFVHQSATIGECMKRARSAGDDEIIPIIIKMDDELEIPEGCDVPA